MCGRFTQKLRWREVHDLSRLLIDAPPDNVRNDGPEVLE